MTRRCTQGCNVLRPRCTAIIRIAVRRVRHRRECSCQPKRQSPPEDQFYPSSRQAPTRAEQDHQGLKVKTGDAHRPCA
jgi:hypothetical protein